MRQVRKFLAGAALTAGLFGAGTGRAAAAPANDLFARAQAVSGIEGRVAGSLVGATRETGEPRNNIYQTNPVSVWYRWVAPFDGQARFGADGSARNLAVGVYTGSSVSGLSPVVNGAVQGGFDVFRAEAGQVYFVQVASSGLGAAPFALSFVHVAAPANDDFARAQLLRGSDGVFQGLTSGATNEPGEGSRLTGSVWFRYMAPASGQLSLSVFGFTAGLTVYTGSAIANLRLFDPRRTPVQAGQTYYIQVQGRNQDENRFYRLTFSGPGPKTYSLSGRVTRPSLGGSLTGAYGARVTAGGLSTTTDGYGYYNFLGLRPAAYAVAASLPGFTMTPPSQSVSLSTNLTTVDFRASVGTPVGALSISGRVTDAVGRPLANVTVTRTGGVRVVTNAAGQYLFAGLSAGNYTLTPTLAGFDFNPTAAIVTVRRAAVPNINFYGTPNASTREAAPEEEEPSIRVAQGPQRAPKYLLR